MAYEMLDSDLRTATCSVADMPGWLMKFLNDEEPRDLPVNVSFFYERDLDMIVINKDHFYYDAHVKLVPIYMELDAEGRKDLRKWDGLAGIDFVQNACDTLDNIIVLRDGKAGDQRGI